MKKFALIALCLAACDSPTTGVVVNAFTDETVVTKVWWSTTLFPDPIAPGETSTEQRLVPASDAAYALLSRGSVLVAVKSRKAWQVTRSGVLSIELAPSSITGDCAAGSALTVDEAELITKRIFPGQFSGKTYDPVHCSTFSETPGGGP